MTDVDNAIKAIERWLTQTGTSESRLGLLSAANAGAIQRIRNGTAQVATLRAVLEYIERNPAKRRS
jgi:hypothetical protein